MIEVYKPDQAEELFRHIENPKWFVLGGTGYGIECQCVRKHWPDIQILACEPIEETRIWQIEEQAFPEPDRLLPYALWDTPGVIPMRLMGQQSSAARPNLFEGDPTIIQVETVTLDMLDEQYGPFEDAVLWLDVEHAELQALTGGSRLMQSGRVKLVNTEYMSICSTADIVVSLLGSWGYKCITTHQRHQGHHDRIYKHASP